MIQILGCYRVCVSLDLGVEHFAPVISSLIIFLLRYCPRIFFIYEEKCPRIDFGRSVLFRREIARAKYRASILNSSDAEF